VREGVRDDRPGTVAISSAPAVSGVGTALTDLSRKGILRAADSRHLQGVVQRHGMRLGAGRFVAGETLDECVAVLERLNAAGLHANTTLLGEAIRDPLGAAAVAAEYERVLDRLGAEDLRVNVALKLTHLGLSFDEETSYTNVERVVARAAATGRLVRIDMEQSEYVDATLGVYERLRASGLENVGVALQSYLRRTPADLERLLPLGPNIRIVKGAYLEPPSVAHPRKRDVDAAYVQLVERGLDRGAYVAVATHDERIIGRVQRLAKAAGIGRDRFEFQMLYGVRPALQRRLVTQGYKVLVATPFGPDWYPYLMRRLAERPANLLFFLSNLVRR
jgi:proline dehydrogenase